tara:strand:+ start:86 stop:364 length:279 start_codon:yes stop_codon:yes gene_type:complete
MRKRTKKLRKKKVKRGGSSSTYTRSNTYQSREAERQKREIAMAKVLESQRREEDRQLREIDLAKVAKLRKKIKGRKRSRGSITGTYTAGIKK